MTFVYVIRADDEIHKVGWSIHPETRLFDLQCAHYSELSLAFSLKSEHPLKTERYAHWLLRASHLRGEWFGCGVAAAVSAVRGADRAVSLGGAAYYDTRQRTRHPLSSKERPPVSQPLMPDWPAGGMSYAGDAMRRREVNAIAYRKLVAPRGRP